MDPPPFRIYEDSCCDDGMEIKDYREKTPFRTRSKEIVNSKRELGIEVAIGNFQVNKNHESIIRFFLSQLIVYIL